jgi:predicted RND superfamily exporter protein
MCQHPPPYSQVESVADVACALSPSCDFRLGMLEAINYVAVIGMSIDYCVHMSEAYVEASATEREPRVKKMLAEMGVSVCVAQWPHQNPHMESP